MDELERVPGGWGEMEGELTWPMEDVSVRLLEERAHKLRARNASCFCSSCQEEEYDECFVNSLYPNLVSELKAGVVREEFIIMDTRLAVDGAHVGVQSFPRKARKPRGVDKTGR